MPAISAEKVDTRIDGWKTNVTETSLQLGIAKLEQPRNARRLRGIVMESGLVRELSGFAESLRVNGTNYAKDSLGWSLDDVDFRGVQANSQLVDQVRQILKRERP